MADLRRARVRDAMMTVDRFDSNALQSRREGEGRGGDARVSAGEVRCVLTIRAERSSLQRDHHLNSVSFATPISLLSRLRSREDGLEYVVAMPYHAQSAQAASRAPPRRMLKRCCSQLPLTRSCSCASDPRCTDGARSRSSTDVIGLEPTEQTPSKMPWWLLLLRLCGPPRDLAVARPLLIRRPTGRARDR